MNTDQVADCADGKISEQGHRNTARQQRRRAPRGPIYLHTFKYFLTAPAQLQPCCTAVAGRRPWLAFRWQCQKTVSHGSTCKPATSAVMPLTIPIEFSLQFFFPPPLCLIPPGSSNCEMLFTKLMSFCGIFIYHLDGRFQVA